MTVLRRRLTAAVALALVSFLAAGCSSGSATPPGAPSAPETGKPAGAGSPSGGTEEAQGGRAKAVLDEIPPDGPEFVESGLERVPDGVHTRSSLMEGRKVSVACVGTGTVKSVIGEQAPQPVPCDGTSATRRVQNSPAQLPINIAAASDATGMIAWQITALSS
ncbi:hypothetical protein [Streptomyces nojiriensis]|uniref:hypothetical protein n=1 Tax=Streptomyces nojiriensis TaxID=66374 RepID=UPI00364BE8DD